MSSSNQAVKTIVVAGVLCVVCSIIVSAVVVNLRPQQQENAALDYKKNILLSAGLMNPGDDVEEAFKKVETVMVDFSTGEVVAASDIKEIKSIDSYDQNKAAKKPDLSVQINKQEDVANLGRRAKYAKVFLTRDAQGKPETIIMSIRSKGLWSTMLGFIALEADVKTVKGFAYYSHGETPGLGGEVDNPNWKKQWVGKSIYDDDFKVAFEVIKGSVDAQSSTAQYKVDGLSGATITSVGVSDSIEYWFGSNGYKNFLTQVKSGNI